MSHQNTIKTLIQSEAIASVLTRDSHAKKEIMALQTILHELGFGSELNWEKYGADGSYGKSTVTAVALFTQKNRLKGDGITVTQEIAEVILARHEILDDLRYLQNLIERGDVQKRRLSLWEPTPIGFYSK